MAEDYIDIQIAEIIKNDNRYCRDAYQFINKAISYSTEKVDFKRHIKAAELLVGVAEYALSCFGPMASAVLNHWNITNSGNVGEIVFILARHKVIITTEEDSLSDFVDSDFDLHEALKQPFIVKDTIVNINKID